MSCILLTTIIATYLVDLCLFYNSNSIPRIVSKCCRTVTIRKSKFHFLTFNSRGNLGSKGITTNLLPGVLTRSANLIHKFDLVNQPFYYISV